MLGAPEVNGRSNLPARRRCFLLWVLSGVLAGSWIGSSPAAETKPQTVQMVVDYGDGAEIRLTALPHRAGMTVLDAIEAAGAHPHGVKFKLRGMGTTTFVTQIGDVKNEGGGVKNRNWIYTVDGEQPEVGVGAFELKPGNVILWKFGVADYNR